MFDNPFKQQYQDIEQNFNQQATPQFNMQGQQFNNQSQPHTQNTGSTQASGVYLSADDVQKIIDGLRVQQMTNPVKIVEPSYVVTENQMQQLLALAKGVQTGQLNYDINREFAFNQQQSMPMPSQRQIFPQQAKNIIDDVANITLGTVGRIGHTMTGLVDGIVDVLTLGYAKK